MNMFGALNVNIVLHAEKLFSFHGLGITNSMLLGWIVSALLVVGLAIAAKRIKVTSGGKTLSIVEVLCESVTTLAADVMDRERAAAFAPFFITLFVFIMANNWAGLLPGVGSITYHGQPLLRAWTSDLTGTLALSISCIVLIQVFTIKRLGGRKHAAHYFTNKPWNPINFFVGLLEVLSEFTRIASLALRLFGNIFAGEVLLLVLSAITSFGSPLATLPFIFMELFIGFIQAFVFTTLVIVYLALATTSHEEGEHESADHSASAEPAIKLAPGSPSAG